MKKNEIKMIGIIILIGLVIIGIILITRKPKEETSKEITSSQQTAQTTKNEEYAVTFDDGSKMNTSNKLNEKKKLGDLEIGNISLTYKNNKSVVLADVKNTSNNTVEKQLVTLTLFDKNGAEIINLDGIIPKLEAGKTTQLNIGTSKDIANAYNFSIIKK